MEQKQLQNLQQHFNFNSHDRKYAPDEIFYAGDLNLLLNGARVSVVGSRKPSENGIKRTRALVKSLVKQGITVVSGMAEGVDTIAHNTALKSGGKTIAVLGSPLDNPYPKSNTLLFNELVKNHLVISQFQNGNQIKKGNFPIRNRTMALISDATIIVEASETSGTRHQGWEAIRLGRTLYLLENVANNKSLSWPAQMIEHGAKILQNINLEERLNSIPRNIIGMHENVAL